MPDYKTTSNLHEVVIKFDKAAHNGLVASSSLAGPTIYISYLFNPQ